MAKPYLVWVDVKGTAKPKRGEKVLIAYTELPGDVAFEIATWEGHYFVVDYGDISLRKDPTHWAYIIGPK